LVISKTFKRIFVIVSLCCLFYFCVTFGYKLGKNQTIEQEDEQITPVGALDSKQVIDAHTIIDTTYVFKKCGHEQQVKEKPTEDMLGLSVVDFNTRFSSLSIVDFNADAVQLKKIIDNYCDKHFLLKLIGSRVMVLTYNIKNDDYVIVQRTSLTIDHIDSDAIALLNRGKLFNATSDIDDYIASIKTP
jgi:hypothetical protein